MILFRLACDCGHEFETWFQSGRAFELIASRRELACPMCGGSEVQKAPMAPRIAKRPDVGVLPDGSSISSDGDQDVAIARTRNDFAAAVRRLRQEVRARADYVGPRFAEEARKIDAGDAPDRGIYGEATASEARALIDDGIAVLPLPRLPEDNN